MLVCSGLLVLHCFRRCLDRTLSILHPRLMISPRLLPGVASDLSFSQPGAVSLVSHLLLNLSVVSFGTVQYTCRVTSGGRL
ncbi:hypothetical protein BDW42DRAFT_179283 [Aspergillus taichungensis]|uniref:Uncharacterized protein n=1 Tax=Aspergillus taichungensis TaxID=482145 RepID=A0A2J5HGS7_9EURO|nr:hypothetical protein BDW42DRAFT_179283 [Aspergillus taichungensis]